ncbi:hypothetical protein HDV06_002359 [Boothiomyces sp. JEL0866]|nr:hypothetical protein HDV06_002359 [Boothiomyces sp. JEL0866]
MGVNYNRTKFILKTTVLPSNTVQGVQEATEYNNARLKYHYEPLYLEIVERESTPGDLIGSRGMVRTTSNEDAASEITKLVLKSRQTAKKSKAE